MILGDPITIQPVLGKHLRKEDGGILSVEGETVTASSYWQRRFDDHDVEYVPGDANPSKSPVTQD